MRSAGCANVSELVSSHSRSSFIWDFGYRERACGFRLRHNPSNELCCVHRHGFLPHRYTSNEIVPLRFRLSPHRKIKLYYLSGSLTSSLQTLSAKGYNFVFRDPSPTLSGPIPQEHTSFAEHRLLHSEYEFSASPSRDTPCVASFMGRGKRYGGLFGQVFSMPNRRRALSKPQANGDRQALPEERGLPNSKINERWVGMWLMYARCVWFGGLVLI